MTVPLSRADVAEGVRTAIATYTQALDDGRTDDVVATFCPDGSCAIPGLGTHRGHHALRAAFTAWELFNYVVHGSRADHPTFSSITDANDRFYLLKALLFLGWMAAAMVIVQRGQHQRPARPARGR